MRATVQAMLEDMPDPRDLHSERSGQVVLVVGAGVVRPRGSERASDVRVDTLSVNFARELDDCASTCTCQPSCHCP